MPEEQQAPATAAPRPQIQVFGRPLREVARGVILVASSPAAIRLIFFVNVFECLLEMAWLLAHISLRDLLRRSEQEPVDMSMAPVMLLTVLRIGLPLIFGISGRLRLATVMLVNLALTTTYLLRLQVVWRTESDTWLLALEGLSSIFIFGNAVVCLLSMFTLAGLLHREPYLQDPLTERPLPTNRGRVLRTFEVTAPVQADQGDQTGSNGLQMCTVCLVEMEPGDTVSELHCSHRFHADCIDQWLKLGKPCPMRCNIASPSADELLLEGFFEALAEAFPPGRPCPPLRQRPQPPGPLAEPAQDPELPPAPWGPAAHEIPEGEHSEASVRSVGLWWLEQEGAGSTTLRI